ncbi:MAG TPA: beta-ketoacyl-ACP synthase II [Dehalococcoidia bacterium]|nr:beta-ketoacyl-ACP synthase II [Dehalococcoidia bacterium]
MAANGERIVITGIGAVTPLALNAETTWRRLLAGESGIERLEGIETDDLPVRIGGQVRGFNPRDYMDFKAAKRMGRFAQYAVAAAKMALDDAALAVSEENAELIGAVINTGGGGYLETTEETIVLERRGPNRVSPFYVPLMAPNMAACQPSIVFGLRGPVITSVAACASSIQAYTDAFHLLQRGEADAVLCGGTEAGINRLAIAALGNMQALSTRNDEPHRASRPFDRDRDGFVLGEGAVVMVAERAAAAARRGARVYAEIAGGAITGDAYHITMPAPSGAGAALAMQRALRSAEMQPEEIDYVCAHGTGTPLNDVAETQAIKRVFGEHAYRLAISSPKSMVGHLLGAAGGISALVCTRAIVEGIVPPTANLENPDPECDLDYVPLRARRLPVRAAMANGFGFGGQNAVVIFKAAKAA